MKTMLLSPSGMKEMGMLLKNSVSEEQSDSQHTQPTSMPIPFLTTKHKYIIWGTFPHVLTFTDITALLYKKSDISF